MVFIHGNSHSLNSFYAQMDTEELANFRLIFVDLPGHGESSRHSTYSLNSFSNIISEFILSLEIKNYVLVGHSLGGHVAINTLSTLKPTALFLFGTPPLKKPFDSSGFIANPNTQALGMANPTFSAIEMLMDEMNYSGENKTLGIKDFTSTDPTFRQTILGNVASNTHADEVKLLKNFSGTVMFLLATKDLMINNKYIQQEFLDLNKKIIFTEIEAGHSPHVESSIEFNRILADFGHQVFEKNILHPSIKHESLNYEQRNQQQHGHPFQGHKALSPPSANRILSNTRSDSRNDFKN